MIAGRERAKEGKGSKGGRIDSEEGKAYRQNRRFTIASFVVGALVYDSPCCEVEKMIENFTITVESPTASAGSCDVDPAAATEFPSPSPPVASQEADLQDLRAADETRRLCDAEKAPSSASSHRLHEEDEKLSIRGDDTSSAERTRAQEVRYQFVVSRPDVPTFPRKQSRLFARIRFQLHSNMSACHTTVLFVGSNRSSRLPAARRRQPLYSAAQPE